MAHLQPSDLFIQFFHKVLPAYTPQAETLLSQIAPEKLSALNFRYIFSVEKMIEISHMIEDAVMHSQRPADFHVSFQLFSRLGEQMPRYRAISQKVEKLWLYGVPDIPPMNLPNTEFIDTSNTPLTRYWFLVAYAPELSMTLVAEEISSPIPSSQRIYEGFYTFETDVAYKVLNLMHQIFPAQIPAPIPPELL
ncbi:DICT sensory domain-containing protein [Anaerolinea thermophila]|nr:DICT sensory domain-containing protein [Anaerolinea thermophila]